MKLFEIKSWYSGKVLFSLKTTSLKLCVEAAVQGGADLRDAVLSDADLSGADLRGADLRGAVLSDADLSGAVLSGADLSDAVLSDADLSGADLRDAVLSGADLRDADLSGAVLSDADLSGADLSGADLSGADLRGADLRGAVLSDADLSGAVLSDADLSGAVLSGAVLSGAVFDIAPVSTEQAIKNLDTVAEIILDKQERLHMNDWHVTEGWRNRTCLEEAECGTGHCLAGWLQVCSTDQKIRELPAATAGILLAPIASHMFYKTNDEVLAWLTDREYAKEAA